MSISWDRNSKDGPLYAVKEFIFVKYTSEVLKHGTLNSTMVLYLNNRSNVCFVMLEIKLGTVRGGGLGGIEKIKRIDSFINARWRRILIRVQQ